MNNKLNLDINMDNLTNEERETLLSLVGKGTKEPKRWNPEKDEEYYYIDSSGNVTKCDHCIYSTTRQRLSFNNCFHTKKEAEFEAEKRKVTAELEIYALEHNEPIDWENISYFKYFISYSHPDQILYVNNHRTRTANVIYFSSRELAQSAIKSVGEARIKKYIFNIDFDSNADEN